MSNKRYKIALYSEDLKFDHTKSRLFEGRISNGPVFEWLGFSHGYSFSPNHLKTRIFKIGTHLSGFQMIFDKMAAICPILNGWASGFQNPFKIQTICNPTSKIQTSLDFRSPLQSFYMTLHIYSCPQSYYNNIEGVCSIFAEVI